MSCRALRKGRFALLGLATLLLAALPAHAQAGHAAALEAHGLAPDAYTLLHAWQERAAPDAPWVEGYRVAPRGGGAAFDIYGMDGHDARSGAVQEVDMPAKTWGAPVEASAETFKTSTASHGVFAGLSAGFLAETQIYTEVCAVPAPDVRALRREDRAALAPKPLRTGVFQPLLPPLEINAASVGWQPREGGGWIIAALIEAEGAEGLRIAFSEVSLPVGARLYVYNAEHPGEAHGPLAPSAGSGVYWSPTCFARRVVVACVLPPEADPAEVHLRADQAAYLYRGPGEWAKAAGACNLDATCYPDWAHAAAGVGGIGTIGIAGALFCTGALISDLDPCTQTPYFLTAHHCITRDSDANASEFYWFFASDACNGPAPDPASVPRTLGGADRLAFSGGRPTNGAGNDFSLLRLRNLPPPGVTFLGWSTAAPALGAPVTCIHHPRGDFKRITFGDLTQQNPLAPNLYHEVTWQQGTTEPGSSGSPLLRTDSQQIMGQLWGGGASCTNPFDPDYYGRFDVTYPIIAGILAQPLVAAFAEAQFAVLEGAGAAVISVTLNKPAPAGYTVNYAAAPGTAGPDDFVPVSGVLPFPEGASVASFSVTIIDDTHTEDDETVLLTLTAPSCGALDPVLAEAILLIIDDDVDSDGDGISDADELSGFFGFVTDPFNPDTDGDGLTDGEEVFGVYGFFTDPTRRDTDGDGIWDFDEILLGLDPTDMTDGNKLSSLEPPWFGEAP